MSVVRQDAWSEDDDLILAEVTLRHIREGSTQLKAFEEVGERIGRTAAACGFRWNSCVRKRYEAAIQIAKAQRQKRMQLRKKGNPIDDQENEAFIANITSQNQDDKSSMVSEQSFSVDAVIRFLRQWKNENHEVEKRVKTLERELRAKDEQFEQLRMENERLNKEVNEVSSDYRVVNDDYKALIQIMDRARKLAFLADEDKESKARFKMDANGNLERIE